MHFNSEDDYRTGCGNDSPCQQQSYKLSFGYVSTAATQRPGKTPTKNREKEGENRGHLGRNPASPKTEVKLYLFIYLFNLLFELNLHHTKRIHITT